MILHPLDIMTRHLYAATSPLLRTYVQLLFPLLFVIQTLNRLEESSLCVWHHLQQHLRQPTQSCRLIKATASMLSFSCEGNVGRCFVGDLCIRATPALLIFLCARLLLLISCSTISMPGLALLALLDVKSCTLCSHGIQPAPNPEPLSKHTCPLQVNAYGFLEGMEELMGKLQAAGHDMHIMSNYTAWWR